jgi:hypothetical protein
MSEKNTKTSWIYDLRKPQLIEKLRKWAEEDSSVTFNESDNVDKL